MESLENKILILEQKIKRIEIKVDKLPYKYSSLKKFIDEETMNIHYNKHYKGYVDNLNKEINRLNINHNGIESIIKNISRYNKKIRNNAGGTFNHSLFWKMLSPTTQTPKGNILSEINKQFGNFPTFKEKFTNKANSKFGSGWIWLVLTKRNTLKIMTTNNQDNPLMNVIDGSYPLLGLDLWEHAYYLKYQNKRDEYINNFWTSINWEFVESQYNKLTTEE